MEDYEEQIILINQNEREHLNRKRKAIANTIKGNVFLEDFRPVRIEREKVQSVFVNKTGFDQVLEQMGNVNLAKKDYLQYNVWQIRKSKLQ